MESSSICLSVCLSVCLFTAVAATFSDITGRVGGNYAFGLGMTFVFILGLIFMLDLSLGEIDLVQEFSLDALQARVLNAATDRF